MSIGKENCPTNNLGLATAHVAWVQTSVAYSVLLAEPGQKSLQSESIAAVRRGAVASLVGVPVVGIRRDPFALVGSHEFIVVVHAH